jgi:Caspase domain
MPFSRCDAPTVFLLERAFDAMLMRVAITIVLLLLPTALHSQAEKRIALLIGNRAYDPSVGVLKNPHNDIAVVGEALAKQGFEVLPPIRDARRSAILAGVRELARKLNAAGSGAIGLLYYSGHGAAEKDTNTNYLIPIDAKEPGTAAFWDESLKLDDILRLLDGAHSAAKFIVFDACRNELQLPTKDTTKGLVPVVEQQGMFIAYASAPGRTASDRGNNSGPYAEALAAELGKPGVDHLSLFQNVKETVYAASGGAQQPWESNGLVRRVYLTGKPTASAQPQAPEAPGRWNEAAEAWDRAKDATGLAVLEAFVVRYKDTIYADLARARIDELKKQQIAMLKPDPPSGLVKQAVGSFEGDWEVVQTGGPGCYRKTAKYRLTIKGTEIIGRSIVGRIGTDGSFKYILPAAANPQIPVTYTGKLRDDKGTGVYHAVGCDGTLALKRM